MEINDIDSSTLYIEIIFSLLDGESKLAEDISIEYGKVSMRQRYKESCEYLADNNILIRKDVKKGKKYILNWDTIASFIERKDKPYGKENITNFLQSDRGYQFKEFFKKDLSKGSFYIFITSIRPYIPLYTYLEKANIFKKSFVSYKIKSIKEQGDEVVYTLELKLKKNTQK